jgi:glycosyltransferase involved in cell wall biosynthesis
MNIPLVTIIVPNYNHGDFLSKRLDSIFQQTFRDFEVILLDDASDDNSVNILQEYANKYNEKISHFIINKINTGSPFKQWEKGIRLAKGSYIWIAESDDWAELDFLEKLLSNNKTDNNTVIIFSNSNVIENNEIKMTMVDDIMSGESSLSFPGEYIIRSWILRSVNPQIRIGNASSAIFKKDHAIKFLATEGLNFVKFKKAGDRFFWAALLVDHNAVFVEKPLNNFRRHINATTFSSNRNNLILLNDILENLKVINSLKKYNKFDRKEIKNAKKRQWKRWKKNMSNNVLDKIVYIYSKIISMSY